jgi:maltose alpha-D-glucosyltransferase/alpha-amylase
MPFNPATDDPLINRLQNSLPGILPDYLRAQRWFGGKAHPIRSVSVPEVIPIHSEGLSAYVLLISVEYAMAGAQTYALPVMVSAGDAVRGPSDRAAPALTLPPEHHQPPYVLGDALHDPRFAQWMIESIRRGGKFPGAIGEIICLPGRALDGILRRNEGPMEPSLMRGEQSNTSVRYGDQFILKFYRRVEEGVNLEQEIGAFLTEKANFKYTPPLVGAIEYQKPGRPSVTLATLQGYVRNQGDAWQFTLAALDRFAERMTQGATAPVDEVMAPGTFLVAAYGSLPPAIGEWIGPYLSRVQLLGKRTGQLHVALASDPCDPSFAGEDFSPGYRRWLAQGLADLAEGALKLLRERLETLPPPARHKARRLLGDQDRIFSCLQGLHELKSLGLRIRIHGDYHLGQVLVTSDDFVIIDFEGEPERPLSERRLKRSPLRDVAGMLRSFHYAASSIRMQRGVNSDSSSEIEREAVRCLRQWNGAVSAAFLQVYLQQAAGAAFLPEDERDLARLLEILSVEKAIYELNYELKNRPDWVEIPLDGLLDLL